MPAPTILPFTDDAIAEAARRIAAGDPVAMPTETVYGLAADATNGEAVAKIYAAKGRPSFNPLIVHVLDLDAAQKLGEFADEAIALAKAHWPGPLTIVVPRKADSEIAGISDDASENDATAASTARGQEDEFDAGDTFVLNDGITQTDRIYQFVYSGGTPG